MRLGERVRQRRAELHLTVRDLAARMGRRGHGSLTKLENGKHIDLTLDMLIALARALEYRTPADLICGTEVGADLLGECDETHQTRGGSTLARNVRDHLSHLSPEEEQRAWAVLQAAFGSSG